MTDPNPEPPIKVGDLLNSLSKLVLDNPEISEIPVAFGSECEPIRGGMIITGVGGAANYLNLSPTRLDKVGGF